MNVAKIQILACQHQALAMASAAMATQEAKRVLEEEDIHGRDEQEEGIAGGV